MFAPLSLLRWNTGTVHGNEHPELLRDIVLDLKGPDWMPGNAYQSQKALDCYLVLAIWLLAAHILFSVWMTFKLPMVFFLYQKKLFPVIVLVKRRNTGM